MFGLYAAGTIKPHIMATYPLESWREALERYLDYMESLIRATRANRLSIATARQDRWLRIHSMAMLPAPAPTSHNSCPGMGASRANVMARTSRLVS